MKARNLIVALVTLLLVVPAVISLDSVEQQKTAPVPDMPKYDLRMAMFTWGCSDLACKSTPGWDYKVTNRANYLAKYGPAMVRGRNWGGYIYAPNTVVKNMPSPTQKDQWNMVFRQRYLKQYSR